MRWLKLLRQAIHKLHIPKIKMPRNKVLANLIYDLGLICSTAAFGYGLWQIYEPSIWLFEGAFWGYICIVSGRSR